MQIHELNTFTGTVDDNAYLAIDNGTDTSKINASDIVTPLLAPIESDMSVLEARMDSFTNLEKGSTTGDAELIDGRVGADGVTYTNIGGAIRSQVSDLKSDLDELNEGRRYIGDYKIIKNQYVDYSGIIHDYPNWDRTDYIEVTAGETLYYNAIASMNYSAFYDANKAKVSGVSIFPEWHELAVPENAKWLIISASSENMSAFELWRKPALIDDDVVSGVKTYSSEKIRTLINGDDGIVVDAHGGGDYTSLTRALYENVDSGQNITVMTGTYDIVAEYVDLFGQSAVDNMADSDETTFNGFQYGAIIRNRKITFEVGSHVVCDWTGHTVDGTHRFSALRVDYNAEIIGLDLVSTATFYAIHDDYGLNVPYTVKYENCRVKGVNLTNANCIGGGCKPYSRHILNNCYFDNGLTGSATVRYHNTNASGAEPEIYVSNCYFNSWFTPRWFGTQTSKMRVYVNNCEARAIYKLAESASYNVDNVELYKWCNTETNPVT